MKRLLIFIIVIIPLFSIAQKQKPKLVIGIVVDQMRYDYLTRFWDKYGDGGFKKLVMKALIVKIRISIICLLIQGQDMLLFMLEQHQKTMG